jgi:hypothetical protein
MMVATDLNFNFNIKMTDPKPQLGRAAIECNIAYWQSICEKYRLAHQDALKELIKWEEQLNDLSLNTDK